LMKKSSNDLFQLIPSLTKDEKRYFKLFADLQKGEKNYLKLFKVIDGQTEYDETLVINDLQQEPFIKYLPQAKKYLQALIVKSLRVFYAESSPEAQMKTLLHEVEILYEKRLYRQCRKALSKAKEIA